MTIIPTSKGEVKILSAANGVWTTSLDDAEGKTSCAARIEKELHDILQSERIVVLSGLGTSMVLDGAPSMPDLWAAVKGTAQNFDYIVDKVRYEKSGDSDNFELLLSRCHLFKEFYRSVNPASNQSDTVIDGPVDGDAFHEQLIKDSVLIDEFIKIAEQKVLEKCEAFVQPGTELIVHKSFLRKIVRRAPNKPRASIFTTNYDLCYEKAAGELGFSVIDGFSHTVPQSFHGSNYSLDIVKRYPGKFDPEFYPNTFHLCKLHGSVDWARNKKTHGVFRMKPDDENEPVLIYPAHTKFQFSYQQPFLEMMARFQDALRAQNVGLLIIGFGFNDDHIAEPIISALQSSRIKIVFATKNLEAACSANKYIERLENLAKRDNSITMIDADFEDVEKLIPDVYRETEEEQRLDLLRELLDGAGTE